MNQDSQMMILNATVADQSACGRVVHVGKLTVRRVVVE